MGRHYSSYYYRLRGNNLLFDCGEPLTSTFKSAGLDFNGIDRIFLSHFHGDHFGGFLMFVQGLWLEKRTRDLTVHLPSDGIEPVKNLLQIACLFDELLPFKMNFVPLEAGQPVQSGDAKITPHLTTHLHSLKSCFQDKYPLKFEAFSFLIETGHCRIGHTADLGAPEDLDPLIRQPLDLLVCELAHFKVKDVFKYLQGHSIKRLLLVHLPEDLWRDRERVSQLGSEILPEVEIGFPEDEEVIEIL